MMTKPYVMVGRNMGATVIPAMNLRNKGGSPVLFTAYARKKASAVVSAAEIPEIRKLFLKDSRNAGLASMAV